MLLLVIQFACMFVHRFATYSQILTNVNLEFDLFEKKIEDLTPEEILAKDPLKFAKQLQQLKGINNEDEDVPEPPAGRRTTVHNLAQKKTNPVGRINDLHSAFHARLDPDKREDDHDQFIVNIFNGLFCSWFNE